jgi:tetratricopeptide (TPR) repeat protein
VAPCSIVSDGEVAVEPTATVEAAASPPKAARKPHSYLRKTDVLRAHLLPKIEALDLSGLFAGNFGSGSQPAARSPRVSLLSPPEANRYLMMANQHRRAGEHDKAAEYYRALIAHDPDNQDYWFLLGKVEEARHDFKQAMHAYQNALRLGHGSARAEIARIESEHGAVAAAPRDLLSMWRPTYPPADSQAGGN